MTKILLFDEENGPNLGWIWAKYEQNVLDYKQEWYMLSFAYKWYGDKGVKSYSLPDFKGYKRNKEDDYQLVKKLWDLMNEADIIIAHNGDSFDIRKANARFIAHGMIPPSPYKTIDTKKVARRYFMFNSNKLDDLGEHLGLGRKIDTGGFELWKSCMAGDMKAWKKMVEYNEQDVILLEKIYERMLPWITNHPNVGILDGKTESCPNCGSNELQKRGFGITAMHKYQRFQCQGCGHWGRGKNIAQTVTIK